MGTTKSEAGKNLVREIMTKEVISVSLDTSVNEIARLMHDYNIGGLPVVGDNAEVLGVVTELDLVVRNTRFKLPAFVTLLDATIYFETPAHIEARLRHILGVTAQEIMSKPAVTIAADATVEELAELMVNRRVNPIPVVEQGRLIGIVSRADVVRLMAQTFAEPSEDEETP